MFNSEGGATNTMERNVGRQPAVLQCNGILEHTLV